MSQKIKFDPTALCATAPLGLELDDERGEREDLDLAMQFQDLDLDSASQEEILSRLSENQLKEFNSLLDSKKILDLVPIWEPCTYIF